MRRNNIEYGICFVCVYVYFVMKRVAILGSTGSIGTQTLDVIHNNLDKLQVVSLVAFSNEKLLDEQARQFSPKFSGLISRDGEECLIKAVKDCDIAVVATRGIVAIDAVLYCLDNGIDVALANKETLVCAGALVMSRLGKAKLYPIDSEHCAISQCLSCSGKSRLSKILLTASGGPFWNSDINELETVTYRQALKHPNWSMGAKITIDSATMMNKALEVIEASWLFGVPTDKIQIVVHRQSVVHSMVEFSDGGVIAQLASADMRLPIQRALCGDDGDLAISNLNFTDLLNLTFERCDFDKFPCAKLGYEIAQYPPLCVTVMNAANDECVESFLNGKLIFTQFYNIIIQVVLHFAKEVYDVEVSTSSIKKYDKLARIYARQLLNGELC